MSKSYAGSFIKSLLTSLIPALLIQVRKLPMDDKITFAVFIKDLCQAYETGDKLTFSRLLDRVESLDTLLKAKLNDALWENYEHDRSY